MRGLDYYTRTVFEFESPSLGAQSGVGGGGRYDGLVEQLGGPPTPGVGWAAGVERILLAAGYDLAWHEQPVLRGRGRARGTRSAAFALARALRAAGLPAQMEQAGRSIKGQMKHADRLGARAVVIVGDSIEVKDMDSGRQTEVSSADEVVAMVARDGELE